MVEPLFDNGLMALGKGHLLKTTIVASVLTTGASDYRSLFLCRCQLERVI